jgi:quinol monooxygenase YgiN
MTEDKYYTHASWKVKPGNEQRFIEIWTKLADKIARDPDKYGARWGTIIQDPNDPTEFRTFAEWQNREAADRINPRVHPEIGELVSLCTEGKPGVYRLVHRFEVERATV